MDSSTKVNVGQQATCQLKDFGGGHWPKNLQQKKCASLCAKIGLLAHDSCRVITCCDSLLRSGRPMRLKQKKSEPNLAQRPVPLRTLEREVRVTSVRLRGAPEHDQNESACGECLHPHTTPRYAAQRERDGLVVRLGGSDTS